MLMLRDLFVVSWAPNNTSARKSGGGGRGKTKKKIVEGKGGRSQTQKKK